MRKKKICFIVSAPLTAKAFLLEHFRMLSTEFDVYLIANFEQSISLQISSNLKMTSERKIQFITDFQKTVAPILA